MDETDKEDAWFRLAMMEAAAALHDLALLLQKPAGSRDEAKAGGIAVGFERAAAAMRRKPLTIEQDPKHAGNKGTMG